MPFEGHFEFKSTNACYIDKDHMFWDNVWKFNVWEHAYNIFFTSLLKMGIVWLKMPFGGHFEFWTNTGYINRDHMLWDNVLRFDTDDV